MWTWKVRLLAGILLAFCLISYSNPLQAEEKSLRWKEFFYTTKAQNLQISKGHNIGAMEQKGLAVFPNGEFATIVTWFTYENIRGDGSYKGEVLYTFKDGSTKRGKIEGAGKVPGEQKGTLSYLSGTRRFEGIQGSGTFTAVTPFCTEGSETYVHATAKFTVPSK